MWKKFSGEQIQRPILEEVEATIQKETAAGYRLKVCIGTDSLEHSHTTEFATVIVFLREQRGGFMFIHTERSQHPFSVKERMLSEVSKSIETAYDLCDLLDAYDVDLEVHADINTNPYFKSNSALSEAMRYILSMGFVFKAKPDAFASSYCADKIVNN